MKPVDSAIRDYLSAGFSSDNCCSYAISLAAVRRGLRVEWLGKPFFKHLRVPLNKANQLGNLYRISAGNQRILFNKTLPFHTANDVLKVVKNKFAAATALACQGIATTQPEAFDLDDPDSVKSLRQNAQYPLVLKPLKGSMGKGVFANIENRRELDNVVSELTGKVVCERFVRGSEYRVYALGGRPVAAVRRHAPVVTGNGVDPIEQLILSANQQRRESNLPQIKADQAMALKLAKCQLNFASIPAAGQTVILSDKLGRSSGGLIERVALDQLSDVSAFCRGVQAAFPELSVFAADVIDTGSQLVAIEINTRPQISSLLAPDRGDPFDFAAAFVEHFFGERPATTVAAPNARAMLNQLEQGLTRLSFDGSDLTDQAPIIDEADAALLRNQGNIHQLILQRAAWQRDFRVTTFTNSKGNPRWAINSKQKSIRFRQNMPALTSLKTRSITNDKFETKQKLVAAGISTPLGAKFKSSDLEQILAWYHSLPDSPRVVVKPIDGAGGKGVTSNIQTEAELRAALAYARSTWVVVEEHIEGDDYRLICSGGRFLAAIHRLPASVIGDGRHTIEQLIELKNRQRQVNPYLNKCLIRYDEAMAYRLQKRGYDLHTKPANGEKVFLNDIANISAGGDSVDVTTKVHEDFKRLAEAAQLAFTDLAYCGVDVLAADITAPVTEQKPAIIEVNANCDIALHHFPSVGDSRDTAGEIIADLFNAPTIERHSCFYRVRGKVTGVGYRKWAARRCAALAIQADIRNQGETVEINASGTASALAQLQQELIKGVSSSVPTDVICVPLGGAVKHG